jgi:predicted aspartyl protease
MSTMGTFRTTIDIESAERRGVRRRVDNALVGTGSELTWIPREVLEDLGIRPEFNASSWLTVGSSSAVGIEIVHAGGTMAPDYVVFAEPGDMILLGARSLEGLNLRVDAQRKQLIPAGPILAGAAS